MGCFRFPPVMLFTGGTKAVFGGYLTLHLDCPVRGEIAILLAHQETVRLLPFFPHTLYWSPVAQQANSSLKYITVLKKTQNIQSPYELVKTHSVAHDSEGVKKKFKPPTKKPKNFGLPLWELCYS